MKPIQIYIGNDTTQDAPNIVNPRPENFTREYPTYKVIGPHSWKVGQRLEFEVDFWSDSKVIIPIEREQDDMVKKRIISILEKVKADEPEAWKRCGIGAAIQLIKTFQLTRKK